MNTGLQFPIGVKARIFGSDSSFLQKLRHHPRFQNRINVETGISVTDCDIIVSNFKHEGCKELSCVQVVELKSRGAEPDFAQRSVYRIFNAFQGKRPGMLFYGASFVSYDGPTFDESNSFRWGRFGKDGNIEWKRIGSEDVFDFVTMLRHPQTGTARKMFQSHHGKRVIGMNVRTALGFEVPVIIEKKW